MPAPPPDDDARADAADAADARARWRDGLAQAASHAYAAAHGNPLPEESRGLRWRLEPRVAASVGVALGVFAVIAAAALGAGGSPPGAVGPAGTEDGVGASPIADGLAGDLLLGGGVVVVHVAGAVASPGVIELREGSRVADAVEAAGGLLEQADPGAVNLARVLVDGEQVHVPVLGEGDGSTAGGAVNINRAGADDLEALPGIGPVLAERIVADRERNGPFRSVGDLARVRGIGPSLVEQVSALATV